MLRGKPAGRRAFGSTGSVPTKATDNVKSMLKIIRQARTSGKLNLSNQQLDAIPSALFTREDVQPASAALDRDGGEFNWWDEVDLSKLILADNTIKEIDDRIVELQGLTLLDLHNNVLTTVPDLSPLLNLTILNLDSNRLAEVPEALFNAPLAELHLSNNQLKVLPSTIGRLSKTLAILDVSKNSLESLPKEFFQLRSLTRLDLSSNKLSSPFNFIATPGAPPMPLTLLDISHNRLTTIGDLSGCSRLQELLASENAIRVIFSRAVDSVMSAPSIPKEMNFPELLKLDLRVNRIDSLACRVLYQGPEMRPIPGPDGLLIVRTPKLKDILLSSNRLTSLAALGDGASEGAPNQTESAASIQASHERAGQTTGGIIETALANMETLDVRDNAFTYVPPEAVLSMPSLKRLFVEGNPIRFPRRAILEKGTEVILKYLRDKQPE